VHETQNGPPYYAFTPLCAWFSSCSLTNNLNIGIVASAHCVVEVYHVVVGADYVDACVHNFR
jgi:hypothetical protein